MEPEIYHTPFGTTNRVPYMSPELIETTNLGEPFKRYIDVSGTSLTYTGSTGEARTVYYPPHKMGHQSTITYEELMRMAGKEEEAKVKMIAEHSEGKYKVYVKETEYLLPNKILTTLSAAKGRLMMEIVSIHIKEFQCSMTPAVRKNIIQASRRVKMYGKKMPIIARFDEYGNRLPEQIEINDSPGVNLRILDPSDYGELYFEMTAIEFPSNEYSLQRDWTYTGGFTDDEIPF